MYPMQNSKGRSQNYNPKTKSDLKERCYQFSLNIIKLIDLLPNQRTSWVIGDQLLRSGTSIGANIVEAKASSSRLEFKKFTEIALKSANETIYWLELLKDSNLVDAVHTDALIDEAKQLSRIFAASVIKLKAPRTS